ncbi:MAG TPA: hypothetical protein VNI54_06170 [Thermoanaerobaculia bacterium]|nr:hypothetical protein [Thermoanaerobaculia bacterium]
MRHTAFAVLLLALFIPVNASALQADDLVAIAAMPLAVAAVSELTDVPANELIDLVATLNQAQVPAPQFIEVVRYAPVALVDTSQPFVPYITSQVEQGVRGEALALAIEDRIETYDGADTIDVVHAPRVVVVDQYFYPEVVVTRFQPVVVDPLSLVAMPLAVAAASAITDVPASELASLVALLNQARVPPRQFVEIVRYSPVALVDRDPAFLTFVTTQVSDGSRGITLARLIDDRYESLGLANVNVIDPPLITDVIIPPVVTTRIAERRSHPHGGPPGQLKKQLGLQTGAEVVHGSHPGKGKAKAQRADVRVTERTVAKSNRGGGGKGKSRKAERVSRPERQVTHAPRVEQVHKAPKAPKASSGNDGGGKPAKAGGGKAQGNSGNGKGKGKG